MYIRFAADPRKGLISMEGVVERLYELLPPTFEQLEKDFACAVIDSNGVYRIVNSGSLPEAVVRKRYSYTRTKLTDYTAEWAY